jgi:uroporphyrinogen-III synthase
MSRPLLVLRPPPGGARTAATLRALGHEAIEAPLFTIAPLAWTPPPADQFDALALTSANAPAWAGAELTRYRELPTFVVGDATARAATSAGLNVRHIGDSDGAALAEAAHNAGIRRMLHLCGREHRPLRGGVAVTACPVYAAEASDALPPAAIEAIARGAVVLLHSPRAAALFAGLADAAGLPRDDTILAAISTNAAASAGGGWETIVVAGQPSDDALLAAALAMCDHPS